MSDPAKPGLLSRLLAPVVGASHAAATYLEARAVSPEIAALAVGALAGLLIAGVSALAGYVVFRLVSALL